MTAKGCIRVGVVVPLFAVGAGCADDPGNRASAEESPSAPAPSTSRDESLPAATPSETGVRVAVRSHCGVTSLTIRGQLWLADPPLGDHNPPPGWDENETIGFLPQTESRTGGIQGR
jgi:hypothetical protein